MADASATASARLKSILSRNPQSRKLNTPFLKLSHSFGSGVGLGTVLCGSDCNGEVSAAVLLDSCAARVELSGSVANAGPQTMNVHEQKQTAISDLKRLLGLERHSRSLDA